MLNSKDITRSEIEDFLINEAALLDEWQLLEWRKLFTEDCSYLVPNMAGDPYASPDSTLFLIADDAFHLTERVKRLRKRTAHAEYPNSITQRLIGNVRIIDRQDDMVKVSCSFITYRSNMGITDNYFGRHEYTLVCPEGTILIKEKRSILKMGALRPHGKLSIII